MEQGEYSSRHRRLRLSAGLTIVRNALETQPVVALAYAMRQPGLIGNLACELSDVDTKALPARMSRLHIV